MHRCDGVYLLLLAHSISRTLKIAAKFHIFGTQMQLLNHYYYKKKNRFDRMDNPTDAHKRQRITILDGITLMILYSANANSCTDNVHSTDHNLRGQGSGQP